MQVGRQISCGIYNGDVYLAADGLALGDGNDHRPIGLLCPAVFPELEGEAHLLNFFQLLAAQRDLYQGGLGLLVVAHLLQENAAG